MYSPCCGANKVGTEVKKLTIYEKLLERERERESLESILRQVDKSSYVNVRSEPVIEILSVNFSFSKSTYQWKEFYGDIYVYDAQSQASCNNQVFIYEQDRDNPDITPTLRLTGPHYAMSMNSPFLYMDVWDKLTGKAIICRGCISLQKTIDTTQQHHQFEQYMKITLPCLGGSANVEYLALTFGVFCRVQVQLFKDQGRKRVSQEAVEVEDEEEIMIYGSICAEYNLFCFERKVNAIKLFETRNDSSDPHRVKLGSIIMLSRSVVAVPAYSSLTIQVELVDCNNNNGILRGSCEFNVHNYKESHRIICGLNGLIAQVSIDWKEPFKLDCPQTSLANEDANGYFSRFSLTYNPMRNKGCCVVELFSIFIGRQTDKQLKLHGSVNFVGTGGKQITVFQRDKSDPYVLSPGCNLLPIGGHKNALLPRHRKFHVCVELEDIENGEPIKGIANSSNGIHEQFEPWYNRLLCSVIKGSSSFAAVHYAVFSCALKVTMKIVFLYKGEHSINACSRIHGNLVACYGKYGCGNAYERLYFRSVLFECSEENPLEHPCKDFDIELLRSVVALPCDSSLDILVDLSCFFASTGFTGRLMETLVIPIARENAAVHGDDFGINIALQWTQP